MRVLGLFNGVLAVGLRLPVLIVTLGTLSMYRGLSLVVNDSRAVVPPREVRDSPFFELFTADVFGRIPVVSIVFVALAVVLHVVLHKTRFGYRTLAIGSNPEAARLAGVPIGRTKIQVLVLMGAVAGLSGVLFVGFRGAVDPNSGADFLLPVIAAVIIGGTPLAGGAGTIFGTMIGVLIIAVIGSGVRVPRHRCRVEHVRHRPRHRRRRRRRPARTATSQAPHRAIPGGDLTALPPDDQSGTTYRESRTRRT